MNQIIIQHRINTISDLKSTPYNYGIEVDIRESNGRLICAHDPFQPGDLFEEFLEYFNHQFLIANIKEEGIEQSVIMCLNRYSIKDYFLLDVSFPFIYKLCADSKNKIALRVSDYEKLNIELLKKLNIHWLWLDSFERFTHFDIHKIQSQVSYSLKVCLVSPELHMNRDKDLTMRIMDQIQSSNLFFDAICTKNPTLWKPC
jgi:hypothetical protein